MTTLIKNVFLLYGDERETKKEDVFLSGDRISAIGSFPRKSADKVIDGENFFLSPGFIDIDNTSDHYLSLFTDPIQEDSLKQGVTTIIGGHCGASLAPLLLGNLESLKEWADIESVNIDWHTVKEFFSVLSPRPFGVNFGTLIGHTTLRNDLTAGMARDLTEDELNSLIKILSEACEHGAFGMSTNLNSLRGGSASRKELKILARQLKKNNSLYSTHLRKRDAAEQSINEILDLSREYDLECLISHFSPLKGLEKDYEKALSQLEVSESKVHFSIHPFAWSTIPIYIFLPIWAKTESLLNMKKVIKDRAREEKLLNDMPDISPRDFVIAQSKTNNVFAGKSLEDIKKIYGLKSAKQALLRLMRTTDLNAIIHYKNLSEKMIKKALKNPKSIIGSHASGGISAKTTFLKSDRSTKTFSSFLDFVRKEKILSLEEAVKKITSLPAKKLGIKNRGVITVGSFADLVIFNDKGVKSVILNGEEAVSEGEIKNSKLGRILKHT